jgi:hypothetical protein
MSLPPTANGVESLTAVEGIRIVDTGGNRFTVGLNVIREIYRQSDIFNTVLPPGISNYAFGPLIEFNYSGLYLVTAAMSLDGSGEIVAGPDDRIVFGLQDYEGNIVVSIPMKVYNRPADDPVPQLTTFSVVVVIDRNFVYQPIIQAYNVSGQLDAPSGGIALNMAPLTSTGGGVGGLQLANNVNGKVTLTPM